MVGRNEAPSPCPSPPTSPLQAGGGCLPGINVVLTAAELSPEETPQETVMCLPDAHGLQRLKPQLSGVRGGFGELSLAGRKAIMEPSVLAFSQDTLCPRRTDFKPLKHLRALAEAVLSAGNTLSCLLPPPFLTFRSLVR